MVDSTKLAQQLDPEQMLELISSYHRMSAREIERFDGFVAKYMGDGILAYFGYPQAHEDDAVRALHAGLGVVNADRSQSAEPGRADNVGYSVQDLGIATGPVVVGAMVGAGLSEEISVVGTTPNLAARLQEIAGPNGVVVAAETRRLAGEAFAYQDLGLRQLKGLVDPVAVFRLLGSCETSSRFEARQARKLAPFVGRGRELANLLEGWKSAKAGTARVVIVSGDPGIGKSRLLHALREAVAIEPHLQLRFPLLSPTTRTARFTRTSNCWSGRQGSSAATHQPLNWTSWSGCSPTAGLVGPEQVAPPRIAAAVDSERRPLPAARAEPAAAKAADLRSVLTAHVPGRLSAATADAAALRGCALDRSDVSGAT